MLTFPGDYNDSVGSFPVALDDSRTTLRKPCEHWRSVTSSTGYSIINFYKFLGVAECDSLSLNINMAKQVT